jgi:hypothetical protein
MLETLLQIGKTFREASQADAKWLKYHWSFKPAPQNNENNVVKYFSVIVEDDFNFDLKSKSLIPEKDVDFRYLYLKYKTTATDPQVRYIFGDICYGRDKNGKELSGYYTDNKGKDSFEIGSKNANATFNNITIQRIRGQFDKRRDDIRKFLIENCPNIAKQNNYVFLHFNFAGKHWYELPDVQEQIHQTLKDVFFLKTDKGFVNKSFLYKTIAAAGGEDIQFPMFDAKNATAVRLFEDEISIQNLFYAIDYAKKARIKIGDIKVIVLPKSEKLTAKHYDDFVQGIEKNAFDEQSDVEETIASIHEANQVLTPALVNDESDSLFDEVSNYVPSEQEVNNLSFDFVFSLSGGMKPDKDLIEVSGITKSFLAELSKNIREKRLFLYEERSIEQQKNKLFPKSIPKLHLMFSIKEAFYRILSVQAGKKNPQKRFKNHLLKVLPQIYTGTYYRDDVLMPLFIEKVESSIRGGEQKNNANYFNLFKYDFYYLTKIQNSIEDKIMEMKNEKSYQAGIRLGKMARPLRVHINSFEKRYVGLLSQRISDIKNVRKFSVFLNEKLNIHEESYFQQSTYLELVDIINQMNDKDYNKYECAFGFFEGYYRYEETQKNSTSIK